MAARNLVFGQVISTGLGEWHQNDKTTKHLFINAFLVNYHFLKKENFHEQETSNWHFGAGAALVGKIASGIALCYNQRTKIITVRYLK